MWRWSRDSCDRGCLPRSGPSGRAFRRASGQSFLIPPTFSHGPRSQTQKKAPRGVLSLIWRWARDSNPGNLSVQRFSRPPLSTTQPAHLNCLPESLPARSAHYIAALHSIKLLRCLSGGPWASWIVASARDVLLNDRDRWCLRLPKQLTFFGRYFGLSDRSGRNPRVVHRAAHVVHTGC